MKNLLGTDLKSIVNEIEKHEVIILHRHSFPDGDAIGSQAGMRFLIEENYPGKKVYLTGDPAGRYGFVYGCEPQTLEDGVFAGALCIVLDTPDRAMIADDRYKLADKSIRFDHHIYVEKWCDIELIDSEAESCCGLVTDFARDVGWKINKNAADALFTGLATDSGRFRYDCVNGDTMRRAALLLDSGADCQTIYGNLYKENLERVRTRAAFTLKAKFTEHNVGYLFNTAKEVEESGMDSFSVSRGMVGVMADIKGVNIWVNFTETERGVLCELRSSGYNINPIAVKYGGGGHAKASGATLKDFDEAKRMLLELDEIAATLE